MKRILVVDDHEMLCHLSCDILRREGYDAVPATSATEALAAFQKQEFDLVVTDFAMPGMTGADVARSVHSTKPTLPTLRHPATATKTRRAIECRLRAATTVYACLI